MFYSMENSRQGPRPLSGDTNSAPIFGSGFKSGMDGWKTSGVKSEYWENRPPFVWKARGEINPREMPSFVEQRGSIFLGMPGSAGWERHQPLKNSNFHWFEPKSIGWSQKITLFEAAGTRREMWRRSGMHPQHLGEFLGHSSAKRPKFFFFFFLPLWMYQPHETRMTQICQSSGV